MSEPVTQFVIDPPWPKKKGGIRAARPNQGREIEYATMTVPAIGALLDEAVLPKDDISHNVFLWSVDEFLVGGEQMMLDRGYRRHARFVWDKENGVAPAFSIRYCHEYMTWFYKPKFMPVASDQRGKFSTVIRERSREHSRKPDAAYQLVDALYPNEPKMDVFSREPRTGWSQFGNQTDKFGLVLQ